LQDRLDFLLHSFLTYSLGRPDLAKTVSSSFPPLRHFSPSLLSQFSVMKCPRDLLRPPQSEIVAAAPFFLNLRVHRPPPYISRGRERDRRDWASCSLPFWALFFWPQQSELTSSSPVAQNASLSFISSSRFASPRGLRSGFFFFSAAASCFGFPRLRSSGTPHPSRRSVLTLERFPISRREHDATLCFFEEMVSVLSTTVSGVDCQPFPPVPRPSALLLLFAKVFELIDARCLSATRRLSTRPPSPA